MIKNKKLSIIVPVYNVGNYLEECLDSLLRQGLNKYEVIMVDDGSTDNSYEIMQNYALKNSNFYGFTKENGGLGNARNYGSEIATGDYITFVDSDDVIPDYSYKKMMKIIEESKSDFIIGNVTRFNSTKVYSSVLHKHVFRENMIGTHISNNPDLIYDTTAWNKIYRMDFWKGNNFSFPEGMLYEDIPVTIPSHILAQKVDVLIDITYKWRSRDAGDNSITQQRGDIKNLTDRLKAIDMVKSFIERNKVDNPIKDAFDLKNLSMDFPIYMRYLTEADDNYIGILVDYLAKYMKSVSHSTFMELSVIDRVKLRLIENKKVYQLLEILRNEKKSLQIGLPYKTDNGLTYHYKYIDVLSDEERIAETEFKPVTRIEKLNWNNKSLEIEGFAYIKGLNSNKKRKVKIKPFLVDYKEKVRIPLNEEVEILYRPDVTIKRGIDSGSRIPLKRVYNYNYSGFKASIPFTEELISKLQDGNYYVLFEISVKGISKEILVNSPASGYKTKPKYRLVDNNIIYPKYNARWEIRLEVKKNRHVIFDLYRQNKKLIIKGELVNPINGKILLVNWERNQRIYADIKRNGKEFKAEIDIIKLSKKANRGEWFAHIIQEGKSIKDRENLAVGISLLNKRLSCGINQLVVNNSPAGNLMININYFIPILSKIKFDGRSAELSISMEKQFYVMYRLVSQVLVISNKYSNHEFPIHKKEDIDGKVTLEVKIPLNSVQSSMLKNRFYDMKLVSNLDDNTILEHSIRFTKEGVDSRYTSYKGYRFSFYRPRGAKFLKFKIIPEWAWIENGPRRQDVIKKLFYPLFRLLPLKKNLVVYESYWGREFSCNPKAIYEHVHEHMPKIKNVVFLKNELQEVEGNAKKVRIGSMEYYYYLARAKYLFNNVNFGDIYKKRSNAIEVQTMHGTPLKKLGLDSPGEIPEQKIPNYIKKCNRWDYLTVPSDYVAEISKSAFRFNKQFLKLGYPRNDRLFKANTPDNIHRLKQKYNLPLDKKIILYAPTWRTKGNFSMPLDLARMKEELGDEYILLIKLHHFMIKNFDLTSYEGFSYNVTKDSDIRDLYLISDLMITDYSSVMFDFALLKKPMLFFAYDYENYKNNLRELYFEFETEAPGPFLRETTDLINEIRNINNYYETYKTRIDQFNKNYNQYDDGLATEKLVEFIFNQKARNKDVAVNVKGEVQA